MVIALIELCYLLFLFQQRPGNDNSKQDKSIKWKKKEFRSFFKKPSILVAIEIEVMKNWRPGLKIIIDLMFVAFFNLAGWQSSSVLTSYLNLATVVTMHWLKYISKSKYTKQIGKPTSLI